MVERFTVGPVPRIDQGEVCSLSPLIKCFGLMAFAAGAATRCVLDSDDGHTCRGLGCLSICIVHVYYIRSNMPPQTLFQLLRPLY